MRWQVPNVFAQIARLGPVERDEMFHTFNMGIGLVVVVPPDQVEAAMGICHEHNEKVYEIGHVTKGKRNAVIR
jgi:phosphoribosylformylglycinamidine cyclo-ligase